MSVLDILKHYNTINVICNDLEREELFRYLNDLNFIRVKDLNSNIVVINSKFRYYCISNNEVSDKYIFIEYSTLNKIINSKRVVCYLEYKDIVNNLSNNKELNINLGLNYIITVNDNEKEEFFTILKNNNYEWVGNKTIDITNDSKVSNSIFMVGCDNTFGFIGASIAYLAKLVPKVRFNDFKNISDTKVIGKLYLEIIEIKGD